MKKSKKIILACIPVLFGPLFMLSPFLIALSGVFMVMFFGDSFRGLASLLGVIHWFTLLTIPMGVVVVPWGILISIILIITIIREERKKPTS